MDVIAKEQGAMFMDYKMTGDFETDARGMRVRI